MICSGCQHDRPTPEFRTRPDGCVESKCRECERAYQRAWYRSRGDAARKIKREHMARKRAANPEAARQYQRDYHQKNRTRQCQKLRDYYQRRFFWGRAMKLRGADRATARQVASLWKQQRGLCALTGAPLDRTAQLDHIMPKARGGGDAIGNLRWVCEAVNLAKRDMTDDEFFALCGNVMRWIGKRIHMVNQITEVA